MYKRVFLLKVNAKLLLGLNSYAVGNPALFWFERSHICQELAFVGLAAELRMGVEKQLVLLFVVMFEPLVKVLPTPDWPVFVHKRSQERFQA